MVATPEAQKRHLIDELAARIHERLADDAAAAVAAFARAYYAHVAPDDLFEAGADDLYGAALSHWNFAARRASGETLLRAYNPDVDQHGWHSTHSVVEIVTDDKPFLVDSVIMALNQTGLRVHLVIHPVLALNRDGGRLCADADAGSALIESFIHCEIDRQPDRAALGTVEQLLRRALNDVDAAVGDWAAMRQRMLDAADELAAAGDHNEEVAFIRWLAEDRFTLLGCRDYALESDADGEPLLRTVANSGLGVLRDDGSGAVSPSFAELPPQLRRFAAEPRPPLLISKSSARSTVHRPGYMDYIGVKRYNAAGAVVGERRFLGLYTSSAYNLLPADIPLLRSKTAEVMHRSGLVPSSHDGKALANILDTYPRDELLQIDVEQLADTAIGILHLQERQRLRLFLRRDLFLRFVSCLVYVPRERYDTAFRLRMQEILVDALHGSSATFSTQFSESVLAQVHFHIRTSPHDRPEVSVAELEQRLRDAMQSWEDGLARALREGLGEARGNALLTRYGDALPPAYKHDYDERAAVADLERLESLGDERPLAMRLYRPLEYSERLHFKVFGRDRPMALSDALPILERLGLRVITAHPYVLRLADGEQRWILMFDMREPDGVDGVDVDALKDRFRDAFAQVWHGRMENDGFNRLVLSAGLDWREVVVLRAYCKYLLQTRMPFSQAYVEQTLGGHSALARDLVALFNARFDPDAFAADDGAREAACEPLAAAIEAALEHVVSLDEDRILRRFLAAIQATLRTNFFQPDKDYLSFKFDPAKIPELPLPLPAYEIFVYSPRVEAVHLRGGPAARGGLRWSDRREDFRTEVLGLMKAQMVKNAVIVPVGSKGGFVVKRPPQARDALAAEVRDCYKTFIRGMLDITDNRADAGIVAPPRVVRYDGDDPYLVVAADKGTATFSDIANSIAIDYGFWLGDAFASGGANGYDHKGMGITARGAWESVKRHFRELGLDIQNRDDFTVVGIGDMGGDVFGNGMLLSRRIKLLAAFNHLHIFIDPDPDPERSFVERERLFALPRSSWADYNTALISPGGGVYERAAKSIALSAQARAALGIDEMRLTPTELINRLLKAPVDLLWNGGIGTYVKATTETHADAGDRANDALRVDAAELRCRVIGEGGNLGLTQLGRIEYALRGGRVLTDAIDNSGGVNCSDHEVNIKILLNGLVAAGDMTEKQRNTLLAAMTDEVAELVLRQNYLQPEAISVTHALGVELLSDHARAMRQLESSGRLNRALEFLPDDETLAERAADGRGLMPPELAVLLAYNKIMLFDALIASDVPDAPFLQRELARYFPTPIRERYADAMNAHPLRREIIATYVSNSMLNRMGSAFLTRTLEDSGEGAANIALAYTAAREMFRVRGLWERIDGLDNQVASDVQIRLHWDSRRLLERVSLWLLRNRRPPFNIDALVEQFASGVDAVRAGLPALLQDGERERFGAALDELTATGVPADLAADVVALAALASAPDIIDVARQTGLEVEAVAGAYFKLAGQLRLNWLRDGINGLPVSSYWQRRARAELLNTLYEQARALTAAALRAPVDGDRPADAEASLNAWLAHNRVEIERCRRTIDDLGDGGQAPDLAMLSVAIGGTGALLQSG